MDLRRGRSSTVITDFSNPASWVPTPARFRESLRRWPARVAMSDGRESPRALSRRSTLLSGICARANSISRSPNSSDGAGDSVSVYGSGGFTTYDDATIMRQLSLWVDEWQIPRVKIKIAESWGERTDRDLSRVQLARRVIGDAELFVDANGGYTEKQAIQLGRFMVESADVRWFEEPVSSDDLHGLRRVRDRFEGDVAAGEYGYTLDYFARMIDARAVDCVQADVTRCGGYSVWLKIAALAEANHLDVSAHCAPNLHVPVAAAVNNLRHIEYFHDHHRIETTLF